MCLDGYIRVRRKLAYCKCFVKSMFYTIGRNGFFRSFNVKNSTFDGSIEKFIGSFVRRSERISNRIIPDQNIRPGREMWWDKKQCGLMSGTHRW